jgi:ribosomal protein L1
MDRAVLLTQLERCNEHIDQTDRNVFAQAKRVAAATASGADASISRDLLKRFQEIRHGLLKRQDALIVQIANSAQH